MTVGFVLGKFMPPHRGHLHLIRVARQMVDRLYVIVESVKNEPIPSQLRVQWIKEMSLDCHVLHLKTHHPQDPKESSSFWTDWSQTLFQIIPEKPDLIFASEDYGQKLATLMGIQCIPVDKDRIACPISATAIRKDPFGSWEYIPKKIRPYFVKKVAILGPESSGKTTLCQQLSEHYESCFVPEFARQYLEYFKRDPLLSDMKVIAKGQSAAENSLAYEANKILFCDTDPLSTLLWSETLFDDNNPYIYELAQQHHYDLSLLIKPDNPWVEDSIRYTPQGQQLFFEKCLSYYSKRSPFLITGPWKSHFEQAKQIIDTQIFIKY